MVAAQLFCTSSTLALGGFVCAWYSASLVFNIGMKRSHALIPDVMSLTSLQFLAGVLTLGILRASGVMQSRTSDWWAWRTQLLTSAILLLLGTLCTNISLVLLSVSFTHVIKTCEPLFTVAIIYFWDGNLPQPTALLSLFAVVVGVVLATVAQRKTAGKLTELGVGLSVATLANIFLQLRNVLNKKVMSSSSSSSKSSSAVITDDSRPSPLPHGFPAEHCLEPAELLLVSMSIAAPMMLSLQAIVDSVLLFARTAPTPSRYAHYADAHPLWLIIPPLTFVGYQLSSIIVLARVGEPVMHAVLNSLKRTIVIGFGALWMLEPISPEYATGAVVAIAGASVYSLVKARPQLSSAAHVRLCAALVIITGLATAAHLGDGVSFDKVDSSQVHGLEQLPSGYLTSPPPLMLATPIPRVQSRAGSHLLPRGRENHTKHTVGTGSHKHLARNTTRATRGDHLRRLHARPGQQPWLSYVHGRTRTSGSSHFSSLRHQRNVPHDN